MDPTVYIRFIKSDGSHAEIINSYNAPVVPEQIITGKIQIIKHTNHGATQIETPEVGATFDVYLTSAGGYAAAPAGARAQLIVDADGFAATGGVLSASSGRKYPKNAAKTHGFGILCAYRREIIGKFHLAQSVFTN